jgi:hypothetical protein
VKVVRADERYRTAQAGIESWHCFSAGSHYDPGNVAFGALVGCDEHRVAPGAGFDWHAHRGVRIVSWVVAGALHHEDDSGVDRVVAAGELLGQDAAGGIRHRETNASTVEQLRFVQLTVVADAEADFEVWLGDGELPARPWHGFVAVGAWTVGGEVLRDGDSVRGEDAVAVTGDGELLVWLL